MGEGGIGVERQHVRDGLKPTPRKALCALSPLRSTVIVMFSVAGNLALIGYSNVALGAQVLSNIEPSAFGGRRRLQSAPGELACNASDAARSSPWNLREWGDVLTSCASSCGVAALTPGSDCISQCLVAEHGFSIPCSNCMNAGAGCIVSSCLGACLGGATESCLGCTDDNCVGDLLTCTGLPAMDGSKYYTGESSLPEFASNSSGSMNATGTMLPGGPPSVRADQSTDAARTLYPIVPDGEITFFYGVSRAIQGRAYAVAIAIVGCSGIWPYLSILLFFVAWVAPLTPRGRLQLLAWVCRFDRWALMDVMIVAVLIAYFNFDLFSGGLSIHTEARIGICTFAISGFWSILLGTYMLRHAAAADTLNACLQNKQACDRFAADGDRIHFGCCGTPASGTEAKMRAPWMKPVWLALSMMVLLLTSCSCFGLLVDLQLPAFTGEAPVYASLNMFDIGRRIFPSSQTTDVAPGAFIAFVVFFSTIGASLAVALLQFAAAALTNVVGLHAPSTQIILKLACRLQPYCTYDVFAIAFIITTEEYSLIVDALVASTMNGAADNQVSSASTVGWAGAILLPGAVLFWSNSLITASFASDCSEQPSARAQVRCSSYFDALSSIGTSAAETTTATTSPVGSSLRETSLPESE